MELENEIISSSSNSSAGSREYKVVMLGAGGVGKSAMTIKVIFHFLFFEPNQCLALTALCFSEDAYKTQVRIDDEPAYLDILDTAGQVNFNLRYTDHRARSKLPCSNIKGAVAE
uniref:Ras like without CAAX 2 n=1 Tax=Falco tinnunculus TaxID=100819 RepID=A0A8C4TXT5_FALTI